MLDDLIPIPPKQSMNTGLSPAREDTMLDKFGRPGNLTSDCSDPTGNFLKRIKFGVDIGPFKVNGLDYAVELLMQLFKEVKRDLPQVYAEIKTDGLLCVRCRRTNPAKYSNHSWGTAIDLYFGKDSVEQGKQLAHRGNFLIFPYFNRYGWYWGAEFSGDSVDSMHFELSQETILKIS